MNSLNVSLVFLSVFTPFNVPPCISTAGCGRYAGGQGYNSIGHFCGGWAGNCGDGGIGGSTWYLVCDRCREKYLREKQTAAREKVSHCCKMCKELQHPIIILRLLEPIFLFVAR